MLHEVSGDILLSKADAICHGIAPNDPFTHGLALALRERWPAMYKDFRHYCQTTHPKCGGLWTWGGPGHVRIVNLFTQEAAYDHGSKPGKATLSHLNHCLKSLRHEIEQQGFKSIALTRVATGVGGLNWNDVLPLLQEHFGTIKVPVYVYSTYRPGTAASESA